MIYTKLGGGNSNIFGIFIPIWGFGVQFDSYFSVGLVQPPTRYKGLGGVKVSSQISQVYKHRPCNSFFFGLARWLWNGCKEEGKFKTKMIRGLGLDYLGGFDDAPRYWCVYLCTVDDMQKDSLCGSCGSFVGDCKSLHPDWTNKSQRFSESTLRNVDAVLSCFRDMLDKVLISWYMNVRAHLHACETGCMWYRFESWVWRICTAVKHPANQ